MRSDDSSQAEPAAGQLFKYHGERGGIDVSAAVALRNIEAEQADLAHRRHQRMRILIAVLHLRRNGYHVIADELAHGGDDQLSVVLAHAMPRKKIASISDSVNPASARISRPCWLRAAEDRDSPAAWRKDEPVFAE